MGQDLRFALRTLFKNRMVAVVAIVSLALIVAGNTVVFSVVNSLLIRPLPFDPEGRLLLLWRSERARAFDRRSVSTADFYDYRERSQRVFEDLAAYRAGRRNLTATGDPEELAVAEVTPSFFRAVKTEMLHGRFFRDDEGLPGADPAAILTHAFFEKRFGGDPDVIGRTIELDHRPHRVVGVLAEGFDFIDGDLDVWLPLALDPAALERSDASLWPLVGKLRPGVTREQAQRELDAITADLEREYPDLHRGIAIEARPFRDFIPGPEDRRLFQIMQGAGLFLLLIACANLANLLLARGQVRRRELALRTAVGASRARVVRQLLVESLALAVSGGALGTTLGLWGTGLLRQALADEIPWLYRPVTDARVLVFSLAISIAAGLVFGTVPALRATGGALLESLKDGPGRHGSPRGWLRKGLVVAQVALALVLLCGTGFLLKTMTELRYADPGFDDDRLLTFQLTLPEADYPTAAERQAFLDQLLPELRSLPGAAGATIVSTLPRTYQNRADEVEIAGRPPAAGEPRPLVTWVAVPPGHFDLLSIPLLRGRDFTAADNAGAARVAIVDRRFAERFWPHEEAVGQRFVLRDQEWRVIGVAAPVMHRRLGRLEPLSSLIYLPWAQETLATARFLVRSVQENPSLLAAGVRRAVGRLDADLPVARVRSYDDVLASSYAGFTVFGRLLAGFGMLALLLAAIGVYGVLAYSVTRRTREIGVRVALGASRRRVLAMVLRDGLGLAAVGLAVGLPVVFGVRALLESTVEGLTAGWLVFVPAVVAALLAVVAAASFAPASRAARLAPVEALRVE